ncbi:MAG: GFA family protein [Kangiellaceae bacterium]
MTTHRPLSSKNGKSVQLTGSCLCGKVSYRVNGIARDIVNCFCIQCRKTSGHHVAASRARKDQIEINDQNALRWFESSKNTFRGFCKHCGGNLFWDGGNDDELGIMAGTFDSPTSLETIENIFVKDKSDYFEIPPLSGQSE